MLRLFTLIIVALAFIYAIDGVSLKPSTKDGIGKICKPVDCRGKIKTCPYGYHKQDGCEICKCLDPCNPPGKPILCGSKKRCYVDKKPTGTFFATCDSPRSKRNELSKAVCNEKRETGLCFASLPRFYYDSTTKRCESFIYGGCGGNENNFASKDECEATCLA